MRFFVLVACLSCSAWASVPKTAKEFPEGERLVYSKLVESYRKGDLADIIKQKKLLEKNYPFSVHLDSAYYLIGALEYQDGRFGDALRAFDKVINQFPQSAKRSSALFAMGMTYKRLNLSHQADAVFHRIMDLYPGSPDSQRAWMEVRLSEREREHPADKKSE